MANNDNRFNEIVAILRRIGPNVDTEASPPLGVHDLEDDLKRLLLMSSDAAQRERMIQAQAVRHITKLSTAQPSAWVPHYSTAILCNIAQSERGRLSASSCDGWSCVSHRHNCPLSVLLANACLIPNVQSTSKLRELSAAALLSFSVQSECQLQLDLVGGVSQLLKILRERADDGDRCVYVAATLWNLTKSPFLLLKLETIHGILKDRLARELTDVLRTPVDALALSVTPTNERGVGGLLESDSTENLGVMLAASANTELSIVLRVENYIGRERSLTDQYRAKTPLLGWRKRQDPSVVTEGKSVAQYDEAGVLKSRTCAVCSKAIKLNKKRRKPLRLPYLVCAKDGCEQTFHVICSRWKNLSDERRVQHASEFYCAACVIHVRGVSYTDFIADNSHHELLISELRFKSIGIRHVVTDHGGSETLSALLDKQSKEVIAVGLKKYHVPLSSQDPEVFIVSVRYVRVSVCPATKQTMPGQSKTASVEPFAVKADWNISFAREGASQLFVTPGSTLFWPGRYLQDLSTDLYTQQSLSALDAASLYEFQGGTQDDKMYSFGESPAPSGSEPCVLWSTLYPRRGICIKLLGEQIGRHKQLNDLLGQSTNTRAGTSLPSLPSQYVSMSKTQKKPNIRCRKLNRVAAIT